MIPGEDILRAVQERLLAAQESISLLDAEVSEVDEQIEAKLQEKSQAIVDLASHYLPQIDQESVAQAHHQVRDDLNNILKRKSRELRQLRDQLAPLSERVAALDSAIQERSADLHGKQRTLDVKLAEFAASLETDAELTAKTELALQARERLAQNQARVEEIRLEAAAKLPAYEQSDLFQYLLKRKYGEADYKSRGLIRRLDRWVADLVDFRVSKRSFDFLRVTPELVEREVAERENECEQLCDLLEEMRNARRREFGLTALEYEVEQIAAGRESLLEQTQSLQSEIDPLEDQIEMIESEQSPYYEESLQRLVDFLEATQTNVLEKWAQKTPQPHDDEIVAEVRWLSDEAKRLQKRIPELQSERRNAKKQIRELQFVERSCRSSRVDSPRCEFPDSMDIQSLLESYREDRIDQFQLVQRIREQREFKPSLGDQAAAKVGSFMGHPTTQAVMQVVAVAAGETLRRMLAPKRR